jgi:hypothetical protein
MAIMKDIKYRGSRRLLHVSANHVPLFKDKNTEVCILYSRR